MLRKILTPFVALSLLFLQGCGEDDYAKQVVQEITPKLTMLGKNYNDVSKVAESTSSPSAVYKTTLNVALMKLESENKDNDAIKEMVKQFKYDTSQNGDVFKKYKTEYNNLLERDILQKIKSKTFNGEDLNELKNFNNEVERLNSTITPKRFDENFVDYINIVASLSPSIDPVVVSKADLNAKSAVGSQLVGNPQYGQWEQNSSGDMFWNFFAAYMFLDFLEDSRYGGYNRGYNSYGSHRYSSGYKTSSRLRYDSWNNNRNWSYYNDKYVKDYAKPSEKSKYNKWSKKGSSKYSSSFKKNTTLAKTNKKLSTNTKFKSSFSSKKNNGVSSGSKFGGNKFKSSMKSPNIKSSKSNKSMKRGK
jgi:hypothetical protein